MPQTTNTMSVPEKDLHHAGHYSLRNGTLVFLQVHYVLIDIASALGHRLDSFDSERLWEMLTEMHRAGHADLPRVPQLFELCQGGIDKSALVRLLRDTQGDVDKSLEMALQERELNEQKDRERAQHEREEAQRRKMIAENEPRLRKLRGDVAKHVPCYDTVFKILTMFRKDFLPLNKNLEEIAESFSSGLDPVKLMEALRETEGDVQASLDMVKVDEAKAKAEEEKPDWQKNYEEQYKLDKKNTEELFRSFQQTYTDPHGKKRTSKIARWSIIEPSELNKIGFDLTKTIRGVHLTYGQKKVDFVCFNSLKWLKRNYGNDIEKAFDHPPNKHWKWPTIVSNIPCLKNARA